jgi:prophage antirepressor-like protein
MNNSSVQTQQPPTNTVANINNLLVNAFENHKVTIYGTWEEPLFKASEIGEMLGLSQIRKSIKNMDDNFKVIEAGNTITGVQDQYFLTEDGLYELLYISRKPLAKKFRTHVSQLLKEQRLQMGEQIRKDMELNARRSIAQERENHLKEKHKNKSGVYFLKHLFSPIIKFGSSCNVVERLSDHKNSFGSENIYLDKVINSQNYIEMENVARKHKNTTFVDEKMHEHTEIIEYASNQDLQTVYTHIDNQCKLIEPPSYDIELEKEREKSKQLELQVQILKLQTTNQYELQTKQFELQTKQFDLQKINLELQIELKKLQIELKNTSKAPKVQKFIEKQEDETYNNVFNWLENNILQQKNNILGYGELKNVLIKDIDIESKITRMIITEYFKQKYKTTDQYHRYGGKRIQGFKGFNIREF